MREMIKVAVDAMGGDNAPDEIIKGAVEAVGLREDIKVFLVGKEELIREKLKAYSYREPQIEVVNATEVIEMAEPPVAAIRKKKDSSIVVGMKLVKDGTADAFVSGARVCKSRMMAANPTQSGISGCYGLYFAAFDWSFNRPRAALGLSCKLVGTGFAVHREVLEALGGWNTSTIAEDAEFSAQCARLGYRVHWVYDALTYDEAPTSFLLSLRQRKRWCSGVMQVARQELGKLWEDDSPRPVLRWDMTMFLLAPFSQAVSGILLGVNAALHLSSLLSMVPLVLLGLCLAYAGTAALGAALCLLGGYGLKGMGKTLLVFPLFMASWLPLQVLSLFRDTKQWHAIQHTGRRVAAGYRA